MASFGNKGGGKLPALPITGRLQITEPRCGICKSTHRNDVDRYLSLGLSQAEVCRFFDAYDGTKFSQKAMSIHTRKHLALHAHAVRSILEDEAKEIVGNIDDVKGFLLTKKATLKIGLQKAFESMMSGETLVEPDVMLKIIDKLESWERDDLSTTTDEMKREFNAFVNAVKYMFERMSVQVGKSTEKLFDELYVIYEQQLNDGTVPMLLRDNSPTPKPETEISEADWKALDKEREDEEDLGSD
jgi:hypothetical protein